MGSGRLRAELRYDQGTEGTYEEGGEEHPSSQVGVLGIRLGFDLWSK